MPLQMCIRDRAASLHYAGRSSRIYRMCGYRCVHRCIICRNLYGWQQVECMDASSPVSYTHLGAQGGAQAGPDMNAGQNAGQDSSKHGDNVQDADFEEVK